MNKFNNVINNIYKCFFFFFLAETGVNDLNDFELKELIGTLISNQESVEINDIDELEAQSFEDFIL